MWQRRAGGNAITSMYEIIDCERGYNENIGTFERKWRKAKDIVSGVTEATAKFKTEDGRYTVDFMPERPKCCQTRTVFQGFTAEELNAARDRVEEKSNVRVFEKLWPKKTLDEQLAAERTLNAGTNGEAEELEDDRNHVVEWQIGSMTENIETQVFVDAYVALCEELMDYGGNKAG